MPSPALASRLRLAARTVPVLAATVAALAALPAAAIDIIDDFEVAPFSFASNQAYQEHVVNLGSGWIGHAFQAERTIVLEPDGGLVSAQTVDGPNPGERFVRVVVVAGRGRIQYEWDGIRDLTQGGTVDRIELLLLDAPPNELITVGIIGPGAGVAASRTTGAGGPQVLTWDFSLWNNTPVDPAQAVGLGFYFPEAGADWSYQVLEARFRRVLAITPDFLGDFVATQVPPIPSSPLRFRLFDDLLQPLYTADVSITDATMDGGPLAMFLADWQEFEGVGGDWARTTFDWINTGGGFGEMRFDLHFDFSPANGWTPEIYPPDEVHDGRTVSLSFPVLLRDANGDPTGVSETRLLAEIREIQGAEFQEVLVIPDVGREWGSGFTLSLLIVPTTGVDDFEPLFDLEWRSDWQPGPVPTGVVAQVVPPAGGLSLAARPSVTRGGTELFASRPFTAGQSITIHDVTGRALRTLGVATGARSVAWDGRDAGGRALPAGVYFARVGPGRPQGVARIVRIR